MDGGKRPCRKDDANFTPETTRTLEKKEEAARGRTHWPIFCLTGHYPAVGIYALISGLDPRQALLVVWLVLLIIVLRSTQSVLQLLRLYTVLP